MKSLIYACLVLCSVLTVAVLSPVSAQTPAPSLAK